MINTGMTTLSGPELDAYLVKREQSVVQQALNQLQTKSPKDYKKAISELSGLLNGKSSMIANKLAAASGDLPITDAAYTKIISELRNALGDLDFSNQADREAIGNAITAYIRQNGGCDLTGSGTAVCGN